MLDRRSNMCYNIIMNRLNTNKRAEILRCLIEGNSIRSTTRITHTSKDTVIKLLCDIGPACLDYQDKALRNLPCKHIQCDEIWSFCYCKKKNVPEGKKEILGYGDVWTWVGLCADSRLAIAWKVGKHDNIDASEFINNLASRLAYRMQLTTDGLKLYLDAVEKFFGPNVDYATLVKTHGSGCLREEEDKVADRCYLIGTPEAEHISTSYVERQNLTMRMTMRRFTRLTNGFSKKVENLTHAVSLHYMYYNFGKIHMTLKTTPAIKLGISNHVWSLKEIVGLISN